MEGTLFGGEYEPGRGIDVEGVAGATSDLDAGGLVVLGEATPTVEILPRAESEIVKDDT